MTADAPQHGRALVVGVTGISGGNLAQRLLGDGWEVGGALPTAGGHRRSHHAARRGPRGRRGGRRRGARDRADARLLHDVVALLDRGGELRGQRADAAEPPRRGRRRRVGTPRRARHRAEALPRPVRGVREGAARHAVLRGAGAAALRELLLRPGGHPLRRRRARRIHLDGAPAAHADRLGARQRDEHGRHAGGLRGDLPRDGPGVPATRARSSSGRRSPTSPTPASSPTTSSGQRRRRPRRTRR